MAGSDASVQDVEAALAELWAKFTIMPRWAAIGVDGRDELIAKHGFKPEDFHRFGNVFFVGNPDANAIMDAIDAAERIPGNARQRRRIRRRLHRWDNQPVADEPHG